MKTFFLDIVSEDIPPAFQDAIKVSASEYFIKTFKKIGLYDEQKTTIKVYATPRRIAVLAENLSIKGDYMKVLIKGPWQDADEKIINNFLKAQKTTLAECEIIEEKNKKRLAAKDKIPVANILIKIIKDYFMVINLPERISYRNQDSGKIVGQWLRPLKTITALLDDKPITGLEGHLGCDKQLKANETYAHPTLYNKKTIKITDANKAVQQLAKAKVILNLTERAKMVGINEPTEFEKRMLARTEHPYLLEGEIHRHYSTELPPKLVASVLEQQEAFLKDNNKFKIIIDTEPNDKIINGYKNVLEAKIDDALHFIKKDREKKLEDFRPLLKNKIYIHNLGNLYEGSERIAILAKMVAQELAPNNTIIHTLAQRAGELCKADLETEIVKEFPLLQGIIGGFYFAKEEGKDNETIANAIINHYGTINNYSFKENDTKKIVAISLIIAHAVHHLTGMWLCGERPTASKDPFGMKFPAIVLFAVADLRNGEQRYPELIPKLLTEAFELNKKAYQKHSTKPPPNYNETELISFIKQSNIQNLLDNKLASPRLLAMVAVHSNLVYFSFYLNAINKFEKSKDVAFSNIVTDSSRVENILKPHLKNPPPKLNEALLTQDTEKELLNELQKTNDVITELQQTWDSAAAESLKMLGLSLDNFFEKVRVNDPDPILAQNRIALLFKVRECYRRIADFPKYRTG